MSDTAQGRPHFIINLVHGTFARIFPRPYWFEIDSPFSKELTARLDEAGVSHELVPFEWSGSNSIRARDEAAQCLAERLRRQRERGGGCKVLTIAHSHGGNIALRACHILFEKDNKYEIPSNDAKSRPTVDLAEVCVATIATPFIRPFKASKMRGLFFNFFQLMMAISAWPLAYGLTVVIPDVMYVSIYRVLAALVLWYFSFRFIMLILATFVSPAGFEFNYLERRVDALVSASVYDSVRAPLRLLVMRGVDDEAAMLLTIGAIGVRLSNLIVIATELIVMLVLFVGCIGVVSLVIMIVRDPSWLEKAPEMTGSLDIHPYNFPLLFLVAFGIIAIAGVFAGAMKCVYGRELFFGGALCGVAADSAPDISGESSVVTLLPPVDRRFWLVHGLYDNPECVPAIVKWIAGLMARASGLRSPGHPRR